MHENEHEIPLPVWLAAYVLKSRTLWAHPLLKGLSSHHKSLPYTKYRTWSGLNEKALTMAANHDYRDGYDVESGQHRFHPVQSSETTYRPILFGTLAVMGLLQVASSVAILLHLTGYLQEVGSFHFRPTKAAPRCFYKSCVSACFAHLVDLHVLYACASRLRPRVTL